MKKLCLCALAAMLLAACKKEGTPQVDPAEISAYKQTVRSALRDSLSKEDYATLDFTRASVSGIDSLHIRLFRAPLVAKSIATDFFVARTDEAGRILTGRFVQINRDTAQYTSFSGRISYRPMRGGLGLSVQYVQGRVYHAPEGRADELKAEEPVVDGADLPPVIVSYTDYGGGISYSDWYDLLDMAGDGGGGYTGYYSPSSGGGGSGGPAPTEQVDFEAPESKDAIQLQKYLDCFGATQPVNADYAITISVDLPVDNDPTKFFNWSDASPGHTFITLYENNDGNLIQQNFGFYPNTSWKTVVGPDNIVSKIADDAGHEYQARYTVSLTAAQFHQAISAAQNYSYFDYNVATFNCTDYALAVFNSSGSRLSVPKFQIPGFPSSNCSNTPEGVYDAIQSLVQSGNPNAVANTQKQWVGDSHGACD